VSLAKEFKQAVRNFLSPDDAELTIGNLKLKYSEPLRSEAAQVAALFATKRVLFAKLDHELWSYVFPSLKELRDSLYPLSGKLGQRGPGDVKSAVDWIVKGITSYLAIYETDFTLFMASGLYPNLPTAHKERNWPSLGPAATDLTELRRLIAHAIQNINAFAASGQIIEWTEPEWVDESDWVRYAEGRKFCSVCGFNLYYGDDGECTQCPPSPSTFLFKPEYDEPSKQKVFITGTFTDWRLVEMDFSYRRWCWRKHFDLAPGKYLYKFVRGNVWLLDPKNPNTELDPDGNVNSVRWVN